MRKGFLTLLLISSASVSLATNGDNLIGLTPASRGMGGTGVGMPLGAVDSLFRNPAWMAEYPGKFTVQFGGILFMPQVKGKVDMSASGYGSSGWVKSKADFFLVPEIGIVHRINSRLTFGLGAFGVSGMGVDYRDQGGNTPLNTPYLSDMHTTFQFMRIIPAVAYRINETFTVSGAIHGAWGSLDMGALMCNFDRDGDAAFDRNADCWNAGGGQSQTIGLGFQIGASAKLGGVYAGLVYQSPVSMTYRKVFDSNGDGVYEDLKLQQPQEVALGAGLSPLGGLKVGADVRWINWGGAKGYKDFQWEDQWVYALGVEFKPTKKLALRAGYNYGRSPIKGGAKGNNPNSIPDLSAPFTDFNVAWFNLIGFPAVSEHHITLGLGYEISSTFGIDLSYVRALEKTEEASGTMCFNTNCTQNAQTTAGAKNAQNSLSVGVSWRF